MSLVIWLFLFELRNDLREARESSLRIAEVTAVAVESFLVNSGLTLSYLAAGPARQALSSHLCDPLAVEVPGRLLANVVLADAEGQIVCSAVKRPREELPSAADRAWFRRAAQQAGPVVGEPMVGRITQEWVVVLAQRILGGDGALQGVVGLPVALERFEELLAEVSYPDDAAVLVLDPGYRVLADSQDRKGWIGVDVSEHEIARVAFRSGRGLVDAPGLDGTARFWGFVSIPNTEWRLLVGRPEARVRASVHRSAARLAGGVVASVLVMLALAAALEGRVARPVRALSEAARVAAEDRSGADFEVPGPLEVTELGASLDSLVAKRSHAERGRRTSEEQYRRMVETAVEGIWTIDREGRTTFVNPKMADLLGYRVEEMIGRPISEFMDPASWAEVQDRRRNRTGESVDEYDLELRRRDGDEVLVRVATNPLIGERGEYLGALAMLTDVTLQRRAANLVARSEERLHQALAAAGAGAWEWNLSSDEIYWSEEMFRLLGFEPGEMEPSQERWIDLTHTEDREAFERALREARRSGAGLQLDYRVEREGAVRWMQIRGTPLFDASGVPVTMYGIQLDVTARKEAELERQRAETELARLNQELESRVRARTSELRRTVSLMAGREVRMAELKEEIAALRARRREEDGPGLPPPEGEETA